MFGRLLLLSGTVALSACTPSIASETTSGTPALPADQQAFLDTCAPWDDWDKPAPPFKIHGNTYYVGTCGISSILIATEGGHAVIDSGTEAGAQVVLENIRKLGFDPQDVEVLLHSHEHFDHIGGMSLLQEATGAQVYASPDAAMTVLTGNADKRDPQFGMHEPMAGVEAVSILKGENQVWDEHYDEYLVMVGIHRFSAIRTPGHTPGALSWTWQSCEVDECKTVVYADSLSPVSRDDYRFSDHPKYVAEYRAGIDRLGAVDCDILLAAHPSHAQLFKWLEQGGLDQMEAPCPSYAARKHADLDKRLAKEAAQAAGIE